MAKPPTAQLAIPATLSGTGEILVGKYRAAVTRFALRRDEYDETEVWGFEGHIPDSVKDDFLWAYQTHPGKMGFAGTTDSGESLQTDSLLLRVTTHNPFANQGVVVKGEVWRFTIGRQVIQFEPIQRWIRISLTETSVARGAWALMTQSHVGDLRGSRFKTRPFLVTFPAGRLGLARHYDWLDVQAAETKGLARIERCVLSGPTNPESRGRDLAPFLTELEEQSLDVCRVLSLLGRERVDRTAVQIVSLNGAHEEHTVELRRVASSAERQRGLAPLVHPELLRPGDLNTMLRHYRRLNSERRLQSVVGFLLTATDSRFWLEQRVMSAFTALEAIADTLSEDRELMSPRRAEQLRKRLRNEVREFAAEFSLTDKVTKALIGKLGSDLNRPPIVRRIVDVAYQLGVDWKLIWRDEPDLLKPLSAAYGRRSSLIHAGIIKDPDAIVADCSRIHALAESILYKSIGGPDYAVDSQAYVHLP